MLAVTCRSLIYLLVIGSVIAQDNFVDESGVLDFITDLKFNLSTSLSNIGKSVATW